MIDRDAVPVRSQGGGYTRQGGSGGGEGPLGKVTGKVSSQQELLNEANVLEPKSKDREKKLIISKILHKGKDDTQQQQQPSIPLSDFYFLLDILTDLSVRGIVGVDEGRLGRLLVVVLVIVLLGLTVSVLQLKS